MAELKKQSCTWTIVEYTKEQVELMYQAVMNFISRTT
jgi:hypothetical protein